MMSRTMTEALLPKRVDGKRLVDNNQQLIGIIDTNSLTRLSDAIVRGELPVECHLDFGRDQERFLVVTGHCSSRVVMTCQRCLQDVGIDIKGDFHLGLVLNDEQAKKLPRYLEPVEMDEKGYLDVYAAVEDEVLLCLPDFPMHEQGECQAFISDQGDNESADEFKRENPFEVLAQLKQK
ncbi:MAG: YceD family protein [Oleibacter sp.]|nr:YceD family protein [Thalassolituus sp.]